MSAFSETKEQYAVDIWSGQSNFLKGDILTIIDASIVDKRQLQAIKDLIHAAFTKRANWVETICLKRDDGNCTASAEIESTKVESVDTVSSPD